jgi:CMP-N,N'-diacetyllegionaminic acid synthase
MKTLGLIPARGDSKGVPRKNVRPLAGKSLLQRTFEVACEVGELDRIILSTDDEEIAGLGRELGIEVPFLRPPQLARDDAPMIDVAIHALRFLQDQDYTPDALLLLQPTSPLRRPAHIRVAVRLLGDNDSVCSVIPLPKDVCPHFVMQIGADGFLQYFMPDGAGYTRRQDVPQAYQRDGTIYLTRTRTILEERSFYGERCQPLVIDPANSLNIDEPADWAEAERRFSVENESERRVASQCW